MRPDRARPKETRATKAPQINSARDSGAGSRSSGTPERPPIASAIHTTTKIARFDRLAVSIGTGRTERMPSVANDPATGSHKLRNGGVGKRVPSFENQASTNA